jgi:hypothetical protein
MHASSVRLRSPQIAKIVRKYGKVKFVWDLHPMSEVHPGVEIMTSLICVLRLWGATLVQVLVGAISGVYIPYFKTFASRAYRFESIPSFFAW